MLEVQDARAAAEILFYAVGVAAAGLSALEYRKNSRRERTQWLFELYQRFYGDKSEIKKTWKRLDEERPSPTQLDDLLNFFEFIGILRSRQELRPNEIEDMFAFRSEGWPRMTPSRSTSSSSTTSTSMLF